MIEWWQAWLISILSAFLASLLTAGLALLIQRREHRHDEEMQAKRLQAERQTRQDEAIRAQRRDRLQPVYDVLREIESWISYLVWQVAAEEESERGTGMIDEIVGAILEQEGPLSQDRVDEFKERAREALRKNKDIPTKPRDDLIVQANTVFFRVGDEELFKDMLGLIAALAPEKNTLEWAARKLGDVHVRLESYAAVRDVEAVPEDAK